MILDVLSTTLSKLALPKNVVHRLYAMTNSALAIREATRG